MFWSGSNPDEIPFAELPDQYVVKPNHMAGRVLIIDGNEKDPGQQKIQHTCNEWLSSEFGLMKGQYWHGDIPKRILIEERLGGEGLNPSPPTDYKFYVFNGRVEYVHADMDRFGDHTRRFYDRNWNPQEFELNYPLAPVIDKPEPFDRMVSIAESLGENFDFMRVDLYDIDGEVVFGELTPAPGSGGEQFKPRLWDYHFGEFWGV